MARNSRSGSAASLGFPAVLAVAVAAFSVPLSAAPPDPQVTFTKDIAPILQRSCQTCHRPDSMAPMSLLTYEDVRPWAKAIKFRTGLRSKPNAMPPWYIEKDIGIQRYKDDISLSDEEIAKIAAWADNGAPQGNPADMPPPLKFPGRNEWKMGKPDLIVSSPTVEMKAVAPDFWGFLAEVPTGLTEDRYVSAVEGREVNDLKNKPGGQTPQTVGGLFIFHHVTWTVADADDLNPELTSGWPPHEVGRNVDVFDQDAGRLLKAGSRLVLFSAHLHANGTPTKARVEFGFKFHPKGYQPKFARRARVGGGTGDIDLKGSEANQKIETYTTLTTNAKVNVFEPHMHAPGVRMCLDAIWGSWRETLTCAGYNHSWVRVYTYADDAAPLLPKGTILRLTGYFDNTPANRNVADPRNWSGMGHRSIDNMMSNISQAFALTDEEFRQEMAKRREKLGIRDGEVVPGCPLCSYPLPPADETAASAAPQ